MAATNPYGVPPEHVFRVVSVKRDWRRLRPWRLVYVLERPTPDIADFRASDGRGKV